MCTGYYDYDEGYTPDFPGRARFRGRIVHPQKWTDDVDYAGKAVVVVGSGATAVTLVPELAKKAAHVTMLQRSPTYILSVPAHDAIADWMRAHIPTEAAYAVARWKNLALSMGFYAFCRNYPERAQRMLVGQVARRVGGALDVAAVAKHFTPTYKPWDQRLCLVPDADLFHALAAGRASVVTDHIESFTEAGLRLRSGTELAADLVVTATGLKLKFMGGAELTVDGKSAYLPGALTYKGMMFSDVPNLALAMGYTNASWTLKCDLTSQYVCRLLRHMDKHGHTRCVPRRRGAGTRPGTEVPLIDFSSGYVLRAIDHLPRQGSVTPWRLHQNYVRDVMLLKHARVDDEVMEFT
jgi:cation diffusion facilitator CzcD-associated flavoprotein CzcO